MLLSTIFLALVVMVCINVPDRDRAGAFGRAGRRGA